MNRLDVIAPKTIENGVTVPPGLQVGEMTLQEHQDYLRYLKLQRPLDRAEAIKARHVEAEIELYFGPEPREPDDPPDAPDEPMPMPPPPRPAPSPAPVPAIAQAPNEGALTGVVARLRGYTGDCCVNCAGFNVINNGTCKLCTDCGTTTGCS